MFRCRLLLSISMAVLALAFVGTVQASLNLLQNPQFSDYGGSFNGWDSVTGETGVWQWGTGSAAISTSEDVTPGFGCVASADFYGGGGSWWGGAGAFQGVLIGAGVSVEMSAYAKFASALNGSGGIDMVFFDVIPSEATPDPPNIGRVDLHLNDFVAVPGSDWKYGVLSAVTPANTVYMKFEVNANGEYPDHIYFDNVTGIPEPATIALLGFGGLSLLRIRKRR